MEFRPQDLHQAKQLIDSSQNILIIAHRRPDGDAIGANLALRLALEKLGKDVTSASIDEVNREYFFLPYVYLMVQNFGKPEDYDLIITVDCGDSKITNYQKEFPYIWDGDTPVINIDHHATNDFFGTVNIVKTDAASATHILYFLFQEFHWKIDYEMANLLMAGISFDTGHFRHDNTTPEVLEVASKLMELGARVDFIARHMYRQVPISTLKVWGNALKRARINEKKIVSTVVIESDTQEHGADMDELKTGELITYLNGVPDSLFSMVVSEKDGLIKGSFRTSNDNVDVAKIAKELFQGGGHKKAAGFAMPGKIELKDGKVKVMSEGFNSEI